MQNATDLFPKIRMFNGSISENMRENTNVQRIYFRKYARKYECSTDLFPKICMKIRMFNGSISENMRENTNVQRIYFF